MLAGPSIFPWEPTIRFLQLSSLAAALALAPFTASPLYAETVRDDEGSALYSPEGDPMFAEPVIDTDEWRDAPVRHRYVHGSFKGTDTRFSFYFPPPGEYEGRFFQHITPVPLSENLAQQVPAGPLNKIGFSIASGAYFVETNGGGRIDLSRGSLALADPTITAYRANAAAAAFSRKLALEMYGGERPFGYAYGGSGGGYRTIGSIENTAGVWDGVVPYVIGSTMAIPNMFTVRMQALRVLRDKLPGIVAALEPGGSGDPYAGLTQHEAEVLREIERMGFPMRSWYGWRNMGLHGFAALYGGVSQADPSYFTDFWTKPGYLGHDRPELFEKDRVRFATRVAEPVTALEAARLSGERDEAAGDQDRGGVDTAFKGTPEEAAKIVGYRLAESPAATYFLGGELVVSSGEAKGARLMVETLEGDVVLLGPADPALAAKVKAGDSVTLDNSNFLAMETYHRHQVPGPEFAVWDQFRKADGTPLYPQRPVLLGPQFVLATAGSLQTGKFDGKMIVVASLWDREAMPWQADWYRRRVEDHLGEETDQQFRLWYVDRALHGDTLPQLMGEDPTRVVSYVPVLQQALRDLADWAEEGIEPPASTGYEIVEGQVIVPASAGERLGVQPVVSLLANGETRAEVKAGEPVFFTGRISVPPGAGSVVAAEWDFDGAGAFPARSPVSSGQQEATVTVTYTYDKPGTYFPALRGASQRDGDAQTPYARIENLDRVRVVVE
jgi:hypothetical protein